MKKSIKQKKMAWAIVTKQQAVGEIVMNAYAMKLRFHFQMLIAMKSMKNRTQIWMF